ncbi:hypothetical protein GGI12_003272 [Dipsacomyces acuminosporus]|nr:hypothetical protein GGI12_003272 [Dipsacomyces acuminosporus]
MKDTSASAAAAAAAIYGLSMPSVTSGVQAHHPISSQAISAGLISTMGLANSAGGLQQQQHMHTPSPAENLIPVVFKASAHHPPTISPSALGGCALDGTSDGHSAMTERSYITLQGTNFAPDMVVLFDGLPSMYTEFKSPETIVCLGPLPSDLASNIAAAHQRALEGDEGYGGIYAGDKQQQQQHPCSPTASSEDGSSVVASEAETPRTQRASSTDSTASSATATQETACKGAGKHGIAKSAGKNKKHLTKIPIYLSRNGGAGPTYKTGQVFTLHC